MADILYVYEGKVYVNLTNRCCCRCTFCIRKNGDGLGSADTLWHETEPDWPAVRKAIDGFDFAGYRELTFCGYGEPVYALDVLLQTAEYMKTIHPDIRLRVNTNGLGNLIWKKDILPQLSRHIDCLSISLNAPDEGKYNQISHPSFDGAFPALLAFAEKAKEMVPEVKFTVVDVIPEEDIRACQHLADRMGIPLRVRAYTAE